MSSTRKVGSAGAQLRLPGVGVSAAGAERGQPVIFLHGWGGSRHLWDVALDHCPGGFRYLALDLPGTGATPLLRSMTIPALAEWVGQTANALGIAQFALVGHSMGGNVAAATAGLFQNRVTQLVLVDAALYSDRLSRARPCLVPVFGHAALMVSRAGAGALALLGLAFPDHQMGGFWRPYFRRNRCVVLHNSHRGMRAQLFALAAHPFDLATLDPALPVLIMHGRRDPVVPFTFARQMLASRPQNTRLIDYPHALHCPMDTDPELFLQDLEGFLRGDPNGTQASTFNVNG